MMNIKEKHVPLRMCAACRKMKPKAELFRIVFANGTGVYVDETYKAQGRGMYICKSKECVLKAKKRGCIDRTFKCSTDEDFYDKLLNTE